MTDQRRPSRSVVFVDLDHGILERSPTALIGSGLLDRVSQIADVPLIGSLVRRAVTGTLSDGAEKANEARILPHAEVALEEHRANRRRIVGVTSIPRDTAVAFAKALGLDDIIASDGDGSFVFGRGKLDAVRAWAGANGASLKRSYYYAGGLGDAALLSEVGNPVVTDPDPRLAPIAWLKGWPTRSFHAPEGVLTAGGLEMQNLFRPFARPELLPYAKFDIEGIGNIPSDGPAIVVGNHRSYFDGIAIGMIVAMSGRTARFLGKKEVFDVPLAGAVARWAGGIRVERGTGSDEPLEAAEKALEAGEVIFLMPEGTIPRGPAFFDPVLKGRWGAAKLAQKTKAPVIPFGIWGTEKVWPRSSRIPNLDPRNRPLVTIRGGAPVKLGYEDLDADTTAIMSAISALLPPEAREKRTPTPEELALTYPAGYKGDPTKEVERRPGTDT